MKDQPLIKDDQGVIRFKKNAYVERLAEGKLNDLAMLDYPQEDFEQLMQLIGYSVCGFCDLNGISDETKDRVWKKMEKFRVDSND